MQVKDGALDLVRREVRWQLCMEHPLRRMRKTGIIDKRNITDCLTALQTTSAPLLCLEVMLWWNAGRSM